MDSDPCTLELEKLCAIRDGIPPSDLDPLKLIQSTDKPFILSEHKATLLERKEHMNYEADMVAKFGISHMSFLTLDLESESTPALVPRPSIPVQLIPANRVDISTLTQNPNKVLDGKYFLCRTIAPSYRFCAIEAIVEDPKGQQGVRISFYNYYLWDHCSYEELLEELPVGQILAIRNPCFKSQQYGEFTLKCNNLENLVFISESMSQELFPGVKWECIIAEDYQEFIQSATQAPIEWKNQGNLEFMHQKYEKAIRCYTRGLNMMDNVEETTTVLQTQITCDMLSNRAAAYLELECFETALQDVEKLLKIDPNHFKGLYRKGKALLGLQRFQEAIEFLRLSANLENLDTENQKLFMELLELATNLLQQQKTGEYDLVKLYMAGDVRHNDFADFVGPVKIQEIKGCGRGLVATQDIHPGQLISATKAFQIVFPAQGQGPCPLAEMSVVDSARFFQFVNTPGDFRQRITRGILRKLRMEPNLCRSFYELYAGPDVQIFDPEKDPLVVDLERITAICRHNSFVGNMTDFKKIWGFADEPLKSFGIWILPSYLNHRCWDINTIWTTIGDMLFVRALKEIPVGEEILISYVDSTQLYEEREKLFKAHGFVCECRLCQIDRDDSKEGQTRMVLLQKIEMNLKKQFAGSQNQEEMEMLINELWSLDKGGLKLKPNLKLYPSLIEPLHHLGFFYFRAKNHKKFIDLSTKCHALTTNSAFKLLAVNTCFQIISVNLLQGQVEEAKIWTDIVKKEMMILFGTLDVAKLMAKLTLSSMEKFNIFLE